MPIASINSELFGAFALTVILLSLKALVLGAATAVSRGNRGSFLNSEDAIWRSGTHVASDPESVARIGRAHRNDLENLLLFFACGLIYLLSGSSVVTGFVYCGVFLTARTLHTIAYLGRRPMLRGNVYTAGVFVIFLMSVQAAWNILSWFFG